LGVLLGVLLELFDKISGIGESGDFVLVTEFSIGLESFVEAAFGEGLDDRHVHDHIFKSFARIEIVCFLEFFIERIGKCSHVLWCFVKFDISFVGTFVPSFKKQWSNRIISDTTSECLAGVVYREVGLINDKIFTKYC